MMIPFIFSTSVITGLSFYYLNNEERFFIKKQSLRRSNLRKQGLALYQELLRINKLYISNGRAIELPRYKFFTDLCDELLICFRREGADVFPHLIQIRKNLNLDLQAQKALNSILVGAFMEMGVICLLSLLIFWFARYMAGLPIEFLSLLTVLSIQATGACLFGISSRLIKLKTFSSFQGHITSASLLDLGIRTSMPINLLAKKANLGRLEADKDFFHVRERLFTIITGLKSGHLVDLGQSEEVVAECWMVYDTKLSRYQTRIKGLKLACIAAFFLSSYLYLFHSMIMSSGAI